MGAMESFLFHLFAISCLVLLVVVGGNASPSVQEYWHSKLPDIPMPEDLQNLLLQPADIAEMYSFLKMGFKVGSTNPQSDEGLNGPQPFFWGHKKTFDENLDGPQNFFWGHKKTFDKGLDGPKPFFWGHQKSFERDSDGRMRAENEIKFHKHAFPNTTMFFLRNDLRVGKAMKLDIITQSTIKAKFLPRQVAEYIPFSIEKLPEILKLFSINPNSFHAKVINETVAACELPGIEGAVIYCPTSLESLLDFIVSRVGTKPKLFYNKIQQPSITQEYVIKGIKLVGEKQVDCHKLNYPYGVFYCHSLGGSKVYMTGLEGVDGARAKAIVICHSNTSKWDPGHIAFEMLKVKPGEATLCHFIPSDAIVWAASNNTILGEVSNNDNLATTN